MTSELKLTFRERSARFFYGLSGVGFLFFVFIALTGGFRFEVFNYPISATTLDSPFIVCLAGALLGRLIAPTFPWRTTWAARLVLPVLSWARTRGQRFRLIPLIVVSILGGAHQSYSSYHEKLGNRLLAEGDTLGAAEHYRLAQGLFSARQRRLKDQRCNALFRSGEFQTCVDELAPDFEDGVRLFRHGYRALWRSYTELGLYAEAREVAEVAMGKYTQLETECTGVLAQLRRKELATESGVLSVRLVLQDQGKHETMFVSGNWTATGSYADVQGYAEVPMTRSEDGLHWEHEIKLKPSDDFPYVALASPDGDMRNKPAIAMAQFLVEQATSDALLPIELTYLNKTALRSASTRRTGKDGRQRVLAIWPDAGSWFMANAYVRRGLMPNLSQVIQRGTRTDMISTHPPFTSTAYMRMVEVNSGELVEENRFLETVAVQLKGIPFLDWMVPDHWVSAESGRRSIFNVMADHGHRAINLVFNDKYMASPEDLATNDGTEVDLEGTMAALKESLVETDFESVLKDTLLLDGEPRRSTMVLDDSVLAMGLKNTHKKTELGLRLWDAVDPDFMLLRFPAVDIMSHKYFATVRDDPEFNPMVEVYRHYDAMIGEFITKLDEDDTLIIVSDHGIQDSLLHHIQCMLVLEGPGLPADSFVPTLPIGHLPSVILSRFGIREGSEVLTTGARQFFFNELKAELSGTPSQQEDL